MNIIKLAEALGVDTEISAEQLRALREQGSGISEILEERVLARIQWLNKSVNTWYGIFPENKESEE